MDIDAKKLAMLSLSKKVSDANKHTSFAVWLNIVLLSNYISMIQWYFFEGTQFIHGFIDGFCVYVCVVVIVYKLQVSLKHAMPQSFKCRLFIGYLNLLV